MARKKKYPDVKEFGEAVGYYFGRISRVVPVTEQYDTGKKDDYGHAVMASRPIYNQLEEPVVRLEWLEPPSISGLCDYLKISRETWSNYGATDSKLRDVVQLARGKIEAYWEGQLARESRTQGIQFNLAHNFGWRDRKEIGLDKETRDALAGPPASLAEKMALIEEIAKGGAPADGKSGAGGEGP